MDIRIITIVAEVNSLFIEVQKTINIYLGSLQTHFYSQCTQDCILNAPALSELSNLSQFVHLLREETLATDINNEVEIFARSQRLVYLIRRHNIFRCCLIRSFRSHVNPIDRASLRL